MTTRSEAAARRAVGVTQRADRPSGRRASEDPTSGKPRATGPLLRAELREATDGQGMTFHGLASATERSYEVWDMFGPYSEVIAADAFDHTLAQAGLDVPLVLGHDSLRRIARTTNGTLRLAMSADGLAVEADLDPADADVAYIAPKIRAGLVDEMSFMFRIEAGTWSPDFEQYRVERVNLHRGDVAIVGYGANPDTLSELSPARSDAAAGNEARDESSAAEALGDDQPAELPPATERSLVMDESTIVEPAAPVVEPTTPEVREDLTADLQARIADLEEQSRIRSNAEEAQRPMSTTETVQVGREARTYNPDNDRNAHSFLRDFASARMGDYSAQERLSRHMTEERVERGHLLQRDVGTSQFSGLTVPQYLLDLVAATARARRPLADNCRQLDLPSDGMTVNISRVTTATTAAIQATEAAGVSETDIDDTTLTVNVRTIAGQQDVSFQALSRSVGAEQVILEDLVGAYHTTLDSQIINGDGNSGTHLGIRSISGVSTATITDSSPTPAEAIGSLYALQSTIESAVFKNATHFVMSPRRWHWFRSAIGTDVALIGQGTAYPPQTLGVVNGNPYGSGVRGDLAGLPVIVDGNIPLTVSSDQDVILAVNANELFLWEQSGAPLYIRTAAPGAGNLMEKMVIYGYSAFTGGRYPAAHGVASGTGLAAPTVFGKAIS